MAVGSNCVTTAADVGCRLSADAPTPCPSVDDVESAVSRRLPNAFDAFPVKQLLAEKVR